MREKKHKPSVYFVTTGSVQGYVKIGMTSGEIKKRIAELQTGNPLKIILLGWIGCSSRKKARSLELRLHSMFQNKKKLGEWFDLDANDYGKILLCDRIENYHDISKGLRKRMLRASPDMNTHHSPKSI